jgi:hypothetical protein
VGSRVAEGVGGGDRVRVKVGVGGEVSTVGTGGGVGERVGREVTRRAEGVGWQAAVRVIRMEIRQMNRQVIGEPRVNSTVIVLATLLFARKSIIMIIAYIVSFTNTLCQTHVLPASPQLRNERY